jgi:predicted deacetylase
MKGTSTIAVALHDVEPATFERCALIRDWLDDHGVDRVTLLVIPARDLHPLGERSPEMVDWLAERRRMGDSIAQHGFQHEQLRRPDWSRRALASTRGGRAGRGAEFVGLDGGETRRAVEAGWRLLKLAGIEPDGFVAPAYAYTPALRHTLRARFRWWATLLGLHGTADRPWRQLVPAWSPTSVRAGALLAGRTLRLDLHPAYLDHPRHMLALEWALGHTARRRLAVTYDELAGTELGTATSPTRLLPAHLSSPPHPTR